jgi:hypothetical protein
MGGGENLFPGGKTNRRRDMNCVVLYCQGRQEMLLTKLFGEGERNCSF